MQVEKYERPMRNSNIPLRREHHSEIIAENFPELKKDRSPQSEKAYCVLGRETKVTTSKCIVMQLHKCLGQRVNMLAGGKEKTYIDKAVSIKNKTKTHISLKC